MNTHKLKTWPNFFNDIVQGIKTFEVRKNDRHFQVGDVLKLQEYHPDQRLYTGNEISVEVTYLLVGGIFGIEDNYCVMGIRKIEK